MRHNELDPSKVLMTNAVVNRLRFPPSIQTRLLSISSQRGRRQLSTRPASQDIWTSAAERKPPHERRPYTYRGVRNMHVAGEVASTYPCFRSNKQKARRMADQSRLRLLPVHEYLVRLKHSSSLSRGFLRSLNTQLQ